jgi:hypothetical protein
MGEDEDGNFGGRRAFRTPPPRDGNDGDALRAALRPVRARNIVPTQLNLAELARPEERSMWSPWKLT